MKRGEVYFSHYKDVHGERRRIPVLIISADEYNGEGEFVTAVRLVRKHEGRYKPTHIQIPSSAFSDAEQLNGIYWAICESISSARKSLLEGPIGFLGNDYYMGLVCDGIQLQIGAIPAIPAQESPKETKVQHDWGPAGNNSFRYTGWDENRLRDEREWAKHEEAGIRDGWIRPKT